jgi:mRNA interferase MazF
MITSAANKGWAGDLAITDLSLAGLPAASVIRSAKVATIEAVDAGPLGRISGALLKKVLARIATEIGCEVP